MEAFSRDNIATEVALRSKSAAVEMKYLHNLFFQEFMWWANALIRVASSVLHWSCQTGEKQCSVFLGKNMIISSKWSWWVCNGSTDTAALGRKYLEEAMIGHEHILSPSIGSIAWSPWAQRLYISTLLFTLPVSIDVWDPSQTWSKMDSAHSLCILEDKCISCKATAGPAHHTELQLKKLLCN